MKSGLIVSGTLATMMLVSSALASPGTVLRDEKLYAQASATSKVVGSASRGAAVDIVAKQGGWLRVKAGSTEGWVRLLSVRAGAGGVGGAGIGDVVGAATTKSDPTRVVAVAGLRGLSEEELKLAKFNADELARMEGYGVSPDQAKSFAGKSGLVAVKMKRLPDPKSSAQQSNSSVQENY